MINICMKGGEFIESKKSFNSLLRDLIALNVP